MIIALITLSAALLTDVTIIPGVPLAKLSALNVVSRVPSGLYLTKAKFLNPLISTKPAAVILSAASTTTELATLSF